jgi:protein-S-isoprenylcysteine O-methyltransferase Ste14
MASCLGFARPFLRALFLIARALARDDPALLDERMRPLIQKGQPLWDKIIMASFVLLSAGWLILMGFDAGRYHWSAMPAGLQWLGADGILVSMWILSRTHQANPFLANVVKIQTERGQRVVTKGPMASSGIHFMPRPCSFFPRPRSSWGLGLASRRRSCSRAN